MTLEERRLIAEAAERLRRIAYAEADAMQADGEGKPGDAVLALTCAAYAIAKACGIENWEQLNAAERAAWNAVSVKLPGGPGAGISKGGEA